MGPTHSQVALAISFVFIAACHSSSGGRRTSRDGNRIWNPHTILDRDVTVRAGDSAMGEFSLAAQRNIRVEVTSAQKPERKFSVYVMRTKEWDSFQAHGDFSHVDAFQGLSVTSLGKTAGLDSGVWAVVVENPKNATEPLTVKIRVIADPAE